MTAVSALLVDQGEEHHQSTRSAVTAIVSALFYALRGQDMTLIAGLSWLREAVLFLPTSRMRLMSEA